MKWNIDLVREYVEENGCKLLSEKYESFHKKLEIEFSCGHTGIRSFYNFKKNNKVCPKCSGVQKYTYKEIKDYIESVGYFLLSDMNSDIKNKLIISDDEGYKYSVFFNSFHNHIINRGIGLSKFGKNNPHTIENIILFLKINMPNIYLEDNQIWHGNSTKMTFYDDDSYKYYVVFSSILMGYKPEKFNVSNIYSLYNIENFLKINNKTFVLLPNQIYLGSHKLLKFKCKNCNEDEIPFESNMPSILRGRGCSICSNNKRGKYNNLEYLYPDISKEWDYDKNYPIIPKDIAPYSRKKYYWICPEGHSYYMSVRVKTEKNKCKCNICDLSKGEVAIKRFLNNNSINYKHEFRFNDCKYKNPLPFDFYLFDYNYCIEMQGIQHFEPIDYFGGVKNFKSQIIKDKIKNDYCLRNNIKLIEISYLDYDKIESILTRELNLNYV